ncbi:UDP-glucose 4-epimerase GalE [Sphingomonas crusticola]|uniref:UDP-glucose 4-epimerase GalE n=1 Tax=Sphingomonas crusticola TaxID=1697973 RepID=UPI000E264303|nr:UDP-glucose 4-epimerase GalE [Sphingomonas crusticola]
MSEGKPRSILVTGGAGYIGSHAILALDEAGYQVTVIDNLSTGFRFAVPAHIAFYEGDIADRALLDRIIAERGVEAIMHFAGSIVVPESVTDPLKYYRNNTVASRVLIEAAVENGITRFVFSSTAAVYGEPADTVAIVETTPTAPINPYGASKLMTEWMLRDVANAHDFRYVALRYFNVAGADPNGRTGQSTAGATHLIKVASEVLAGKRDGIAVFGNDYPTPDGTAVRDYIHVSDLAAAHVLALDYLFAGGASLVANCGYGQGFSVSEVLDAVEATMGRSVNRHIAPRRAGDPPMLVADSALIRSRLAWQPKWRDLALIIRHAVAWEEKLLSTRTPVSTIA